MAKKETAPEAKNIKFEEALKRLEKIVQKLEDGDVPLEESLSLYEEGIALYRLCSGRLEEAKKKVEILTKKGSSSKLQAEPFDRPEGKSSNARKIDTEASDDEDVPEGQLPF
jgi:exodeoxyribonuclease VII small subunit